jgi:hypothetical protein
MFRSEPDRIFVAREDIAMTSDILKAMAQDFERRVQQK